MGIDTWNFLIYKELIPRICKSLRKRQENNYHLEMERSYEEEFIVDETHKASYHIMRVSNLLMQIKQKIYQFISIRLAKIRKMNHTKFGSHAGKWALLIEVWLRGGIFQETLAILGKSSLKYLKTPPSSHGIYFPRKFSGPW